VRPRFGTAAAAPCTDPCPAISTVHAVLDRHCLVTRRTPRHRARNATDLADEPNALWCADFKGEFMLADRRYCDPLDDHRLRQPYLLSCEALSSTREAYTFAVFERAFRTSACLGSSVPTTACPSPHRSPLWPEPPVCLVAAAGHPDRADQAGTSDRTGGTSACT